MSKQIKQVRLTLEELHELKWLIGVVLALLSLWALSALELDSGLHLLLGCVAVCVALVAPRWVAAIPPMAWRIAGPAILVVTLVDFAFGFVNFFPPLMRMVILLLLYRTLAPRSRREDLQLVLLCLFSLVVSGALTVSLLFAVQILLFTPVAMALLFVICLLDRGSESVSYQPDWKQFSWSHLVRRVWHVLDLRVLALGALLFAFVVAASTGIFILIPRFNLEQAIPFLQLESKPKSGFSDNVKLGSVSEITEDHSIALRVDVPSMAAIQSTPYWRILVLDQYHDGQFRLSPLSREFRRQERVRELAGWEDWSIPRKERRAQKWTFFFEDRVSQYLPLPGTFHSMRFPPPKQDMVLLPDMHVIGLDHVPQSAFSYQIEDLVWSVRAPASDAENQAFAEFTGDSYAEQDGVVRYPLTTLELNMKAEDRERLTQLNRKLIDDVDGLSASQYSQIVTSYLRQNFRYSLKPNGADGAGDPVVGWVTEGTLGHCELFAGAFVLLARDAGYPARMAVGFVGGGWNAVEDFFVVRNSDAHAWVEIYDAQTQEWLRVDPTPGASPNDPEIPTPANFEIETGMSAWVDSLRMQWYRRIVNFDQDDQVEIASTMIDLGDELLDAIKARLKEMGASVQEWIARPFSRRSVVRTGVFAVLCLVAVGIWRARYYLVDILRRLLRRPAGLGAVRREAARYLARLRVRIEESDTQDLRLETVRGDLEALRFGPDVSVADARPILKRAKRILRSRRGLSGARRNANDGS
ncbi:MULTISPECIES: transglutaminaseTgpA domain-containing protein [unclassified Lentimonas]|uniref:transglutaminaseTgpA domain-containing protein n=1 Tax=unclassified Lentimonas TaxID=2630993 RepID=UPI00132762FC|nr:MULTISPECIES: transglutaminaseTgpA domain-containing protein [unclassified Lentimonas]CAA6678310.1 FIG001454: Transglutaminase-like enzymes, putative cysteine proteases [Lentimonas sp. CC4]CAA6685401.1 FIG001454: Transglutaminase-like enzymes, putative cysteine proteases [Lentimonas sp. CC6]CAA7076850.1 FIG001454: Transglutaminase-like enzymes, putative cysteine proteases [Lentimonas sp. CC4]CAA7170752.1 FIG001454: Transglutaminase-like enzymes, putative cysteine proteases [Lentimonas sp. CC